MKLDGIINASIDYLMSLFRRLLKPYIKSEEKAPQADKSDTSRYYPEEKMPIDEKFTFNFKNNGGKFIYCVNWDEVMEAFDNIMAENDWYEQDVLCTDQNLISKFNGFNLNFINNKKASFFLSTCESLVANNGSILLSSNQLKEKRLGELPKDFVVFATTSQIIENISEGLRIIKYQSPSSIPSNITSIQDFEPQKEKDFMSSESSTKNLYLLLLEDL